MSKITFENKVDLYEDTSITDINKVKASDMNEIKTIVNENDDTTTINTNAIGTLTELTTTNKDNLVDAINEANNKIPKIQGGVTADISVSANSYSDYKVTFPEEFNTIPTLITVSLYTNSTAPNYGDLTAVVLYGSVTSTGFKIRIYSKDTSSRAPACIWIAIE